MMPTILKLMIVTAVALGILAMPTAAVFANDSTPTASTPTAAPSVVKDVLASSEAVEAPGESLSLARYTIAAGAVLPVHKHPGVQMATVESGVLTYHVVAHGSVTVTHTDGSTLLVNPGETVTLNVGDSWVEAEGMVHYAENLTSEPVVLMSASLFAENQAPTILVPAGSPVATPAP